MIIYYLKFFNTLHLIVEAEQGKKIFQKIFLRLKNKIVAYFCDFFRVRVCIKR